jgi:cytosine/adenosine deaminase-related metal-dependent hydrolase
MPITRPAIEDGAVVVAEGVILEVGPFRLLRRQWPSAQVSDKDNGAVLPALINAHAHLDLSVLAGQVKAEGGMAGWIKSLIAARERFDTVQQQQAQTQALASMRTLGTGIVGDISSSAGLLREDSQGIPLRRIFVEVLGLHTDSLDSALNRLPQPAQQLVANGRENVSLAAHAPYTTSGSLFRETKAWGSARAKIVSSHVAESEEEIVFLRTGKGPLRELLEERGMDPDQWQPPGCGAVVYLDRLGFLDSLSLCVHVVHVSQEEIHLLRRSGAGICICPRSNLFLGNGLPPVAQFLEAEISCGLGTDSLASNDDLNLFKEMAVLLDQCGIRPDTALAMATLHGARNLGMAGLYGSLEKGKSWLAIRVAAKDSETIIAAGCEGALEWLT